MSNEEHCLKQPALTSPQLLSPILIGSICIPTLRPSSFQILLNYPTQKLCSPQIVFFFFFERWQTLLPCFWPPFDNSRVITWGISDWRTKIISYSRDPWLKERIGSLPSEPHENFLERRREVSWLKALYLSERLSQPKPAHLFIFTHPTLKVNQFSSPHPKVVGVAHEQFIFKIRVQEQLLPIDRKVP